MARVSRVRWYVCCEEEREVAQYWVPGVFYWRPCVRKTVLRDGRWVDASEPAFPGYLFVGSPLGWQHIACSLPDVELIRVGREPYELNERELALLRLFDQVQFNVASCRPRPGERVRVPAGCGSPFAGLDGTFVKSVPVLGGEQAVVEFGVGGVKLSSCLPADQLEGPPGRGG